MTEKIAKDALKRIGRVNFRGWRIEEVWLDGKYTGRFSLARIGEEPMAEFYNADEAFRRIKRERKVELQPVHEHFASQRGRNER